MPRTCKVEKICDFKNVKIFNWFHSFDVYFHKVLRDKWKKKLCKNTIVITEEDVL